jgi:cysteine-rich repeat protein
MLLAAAMVLATAGAATAVCGDTILDAGEDCDDGNLISGDGCSGTCTTEVCGNGFLDGSEECDFGGGWYINGDPECTLADTWSACPSCSTTGQGCPCTSGAACLFAFSCCKFNCQAVGTGNACPDPAENDCTADGVCDALGECNPGDPLAAGTACGDAADTDESGHLRRGRRLPGQR